MPIPFEFVIDRPPVSQQARRSQRRRDWMQAVRSAAKQCWGTEQPFTGEVMVTITYFCGGAALDVDNIPKPILDSLAGLVYSDDSQVSDILCRKRDRNRNLSYRNPSPTLLASLQRPEQFLHIVVAHAPSLEVAFWWKTQPFPKNS
jgi:hypothetical protein